MKLQSKEIMDVIDWFQNNEVFDLAILMSKSKFLACQLVPLSEAVGCANRKFNEAHIKRRIKLNELRRHYVSTMKVSSAEAERLAEESDSWKELFADEYRAKTQFENGKAFRDSVKKILDRMGQEIAELREEKKNYVQEDLMERIVKKVNEQNRQLQGQMT